jgi:GMP synthase (glutamine-hydrolysing)
MTPRILLVRPDPLGRPFEMTDCLAVERVEAVEVRPYDGEPVPVELDLDGLIVLGGNMSSLDDHDFPWLADIRSLQLSAAAQSRPSLGICLGAQLMAQAFGGTTARGAAGFEAGVIEVSWLPAAVEDPLVSSLPGPHLAAAMHGDAVVDLPAGCAWLAAGDSYPYQAFRFGEASWGVQFHPELNLDGYRLWVDAHEDPTSEDAERLRRGGEELAWAEADVLEGNRRLLRRFLRMLHDRTR